MKRKTKEFIQHLSHEIEDEDAAELYLDESLPLIGLIVMYFNSLEKSLDSAICESISDRSDTFGLIVLHGMSYSAKVDLYKRFCDDLHTGLSITAKKYEGLIDQLKQVCQLRNLVVHADWENTDEEGYTYVRLKISNRGIEQEYVQLSSESLEKLIQQILNVREWLSDYCEERADLIAYGHHNP